MGEGGYDFTFVDSKKAEEYICHICQLVLKSPLQIEECGHRICKECFNQMKSHYNKIGEQLSCPVDRIKIKVRKVFSDKAIERVIESLKIFCPYKKDGCDWIGELRNNTMHKRSCEFWKEEDENKNGNNIPPNTEHEDSGLNSDSDSSDGHYSDNNDPIEDFNSDFNNDDNDYYDNNSEENDFDENQNWGVDWGSDCSGPSTQTFSEGEWEAMGNTDFEEEQDFDDHISEGYEVYISDEDPFHGSEDFHDDNEDMNYNSDNIDDTYDHSEDYDIPYESDQDISHSDHGDDDNNSYYTDGEDFSEYE